MKKAEQRGLSIRDLIGFNPILSVNTSRKNLTRRQPSEVFVILSKRKLYGLKLLRTLNLISLSAKQGINAKES